MKSLQVISIFVLSLVLSFGLIACGGSGGGGGGGGKKKVATYTVGGTVSGLAGSGLVLEDNGGDDIAITNSGAFAFATKVANGKDYAVTVLTQPTNPNHTCSISNGTGTVQGADVTNISVTCSTDAYTIGGSVSGLAGTDLVLQDNGGDDLIINASGPFMFNTPVADTAGYAVTVLTQPHTPSQTCTVGSSGVGIVNGAEVTDVTVTCSTNSYTIGGTASGIAGTLTLQDNGGDDLIINASGPFTFANSVADTAGYDVTILSSVGQSCAISNPSGTVNSADVTDVTLSCTPVSVDALYPINGAKWNYYVQGGNITNATDTTCDAVHDMYCLHGGEFRTVQVPGVSLCNGVTASDTLGAFDWTCDENTNPVRVVSTGLKDGKYLSDLIDFNTPGWPAWKANSVIVNTGTRSFSTSPAVWWSNPVVEDNDGGYLNNAGTIYVDSNFAVSPQGYIFNASSVGLVSQPGVVISGTGSYGSEILVNVNVAVTDFLWLEVNVNAVGVNCAINLSSSRFSVLRGITARNATEFGILLGFSSHNTLSDIMTSNNGWAGVCIDDSSNNTLNNVTAPNNAQFGVYVLNSSKNNTISGVTASNNGYDGITLDYASNNTFSDITVSNNGQAGVYLQLSGDNTFSDVTAANNGIGVYLNNSSDNNALRDVTVTNNSQDGVYLYGSSEKNTFEGVTASNNGQYGIDLDSSSLNYFTGPLKVGNNTSGDCHVIGGLYPGLVNTTCAAGGTYGSGGLNGYGFNNSSDATLYNGVSLETSFVGEVYDDSVNTSDTGSAVAYPFVPFIFDWLNFENHYRAWGLDGTFGDVSSQGVWTSGYGAIWDWSVSALDAGEYDGSPAILNALSMPTGNDTLTHTWSNNSTTTFLRNAVEISGDGIGNDNLLCESGETCLYTPNIGSYQGHGNLVSAGTFTDGTLPGSITGVTLLKYDTNGR